MSETIVTKRCPKCKETKPISEFYKSKLGKYGRRSYCKNCQRVYRKSEQGKAARKRYSQTEKCKIQQKRYKKSEKGKVGRKRYNQSEKGRVAQNRHRQTEKYKVTIRKAIHRYALRHSGRCKARNVVNHTIESGKLPRPDTLQCHYCSAQAKLYHHHKGYEPKHWLDVVPVCQKCHTFKHCKAS